MVKIGVHLRKLKTGVSLFFGPPGIIIQYAFILCAQNTCHPGCRWMTSERCGNRLTCLCNQQLLMTTSSQGRLKPCPHCRRKVRLSHKSKTSATVAVFCDSLTFVRQSHFSATGWTGYYCRSQNLAYSIYCLSAPYSDL